MVPGLQAVYNTYRWLSGWEEEEFQAFKDLV